MLFIFYVTDLGGKGHGFRTGMSRILDECHAYWCYEFVGENERSWREDKRFSRFGCLVLCGAGLTAALEGKWVVLAGRKRILGVELESKSRSVGVLGQKAILDRIALQSSPEYPNNHPDCYKPTSAATQGGCFWGRFSSPNTSQVRRAQLKRRLIAS